MNDLTTTKKSAVTTKEVDERVYVTVYVENQLFGIPVEQVQDILVTEQIANIPLAPKEIAGAINLRGRIVTVVNVRNRLGLPELETDQHMCVTVEHGHELYSLMVDSIGAVINLAFNKIEQNPNTLDPRWQGISNGVVRLEKDLMIVLDVNSLLDFKNEAASTATVA
ncbi:MAG: chemotaxis protein CheW [Alphaproteobacteria bacterium]|nr:chemotaxis protein CheW [Alphaproteobacteria bacterium]